MCCSPWGYRVGHDLATEPQMKSKELRAAVFKCVLGASGGVSVAVSIWRMGSNCRVPSIQRDVLQPVNNVLKHLLIRKYIHDMSLVKRTSSKTILQYNLIFQYMCAVGKMHGKTNTVNSGYLCG